MPYDQRILVVFRALDYLADVAKERRPIELQKRLQQIQERQAAIYEMLRPTAFRFELKAIP